MEHEWSTRIVSTKPSMLSQYADEPDDEAYDEPEAKDAVRIECTCGYEGWAEVGEDLTERRERHARIADGIKF